MTLRFYTSGRFIDYITRPGAAYAHHEPFNARLIRQRK